MKTIAFKLITFLLIINFINASEQPLQTIHKTEILDLDNSNELTKLLVNIKNFEIIIKKIQTYQQQKFLLDYLKYFQSNIKVASRKLKFEIPKLQLRMEQLQKKS